MDGFVYRRKLKRTLSFLRERWYMKSFAGSGIATFQYLPLHSNTSNEPKNLYAILFGNKRHEFGFTGGFCDNESPQIAASRESFEESSGLLHIDPLTLESLSPIKIFMGIYRSYPICLNIPEITQNMFEENQEKLKTQNASRYHLEMKFVTYVSIDQMMQDGLLEGRGSLWVTDKYGQRILIINRTRSILQKLCIQDNWMESLVTIDCSENREDIFGFTDIKSFTTLSH